MKFKITKEFKAFIQLEIGQTFINTVTKVEYFIISIRDDLYISKVAHKSIPYTHHKAVVDANIRLGHFKIKEDV